MITGEYEGVRFKYRANDENIVKEVLFNSPYRRKKMGFDVEPGEHWLDLGANIGMFAVYCRARGATADCFEPEPECFELLLKNVPWPEFECHQVAVTGLDKNVVPFRMSKRATNSRGTIFEVRGYEELDAVPNTNIRELANSDRTYDGIKMDIEGSEFSIMDQGVLPRCEKLVMEYHALRYFDPAAYPRHLEFLNDHFKQVDVPPHFDRSMREGKRPFLDKSIFCKGWRK